jgi:lysophospholipase L1-like esterase
MFDFYGKLKFLEKPVEALEAKPVEKGKILFYGHSLFTRWSNEYGNRELSEDLRLKDGSLGCVNHGFGGSTSEDLLYYYPRLVRPYEPRALVLATMANDTLHAIDMDQTLNNLFRICHWAHTDFPGIPIYLVEYHPNPLMATNKLPDRSHFGFHRKNYFNQAIHLYAQTHENVHVIDLWDKPQFFKEGQLGNFREIREELFIEDKIHPSQEGYDLLRDIFREALKDIL